ncbi:hypothetical protein TIFTF001_033139 [Ficus carica]|uniref:Uncharacterized protein n=1 Tax=Ficus carica TaxID=3494 RepID=A0AA88DYB0_FICCA|nr:hypothetical protein TIFTF001_033139 [Ficus carica]
MLTTGMAFVHWALWMTITPFVVHFHCLTSHRLSFHSLSLHRPISPASPTFPTTTAATTITSRHCPMRPAFPSLQQHHLAKAKICCVISSVNGSGVADKFMENVARTTPGSSS